MLTELQQARLNQYKTTLNKNSKWYQIDIDLFIEGVKNETPQKSRQQLKNIEVMNSPAMDKWIAREEAKMERAGMFNVGNMQPKNALD